MNLKLCLSALVLSLVGGPVILSQEALPGPKKPAAKLGVNAPTAEVETEESEPVVVGNLEHQGWVLSGSRGRHYFFGGLAVADYSYQGERRIVTLRQEEPTLLPKPDTHFLYYRELDSGHRWAVAREPLASGTYVIFYQRKGTEKSADPKKAWKEFQRAHLEWKKNAGAWKSR